MIVCNKRNVKEHFSFSQDYQTIIWVGETRIEQQDPNHVLDDDDDDDDDDDYYDDYDDDDSDNDRTELTQLQNIC